MSDLIRRADAIKAVSKVDDYGDGIGFEVRSHCLVELELVPKSDRPQGEWIRTGRTNIYGGIEVQCSNCGDKVMEKCDRPQMDCENCWKELHCRAKDEPTTQTETQNSNLTFEKDECAKEYEELGLKELKELIEAGRKDEPTCDTCRHKGVEGCEQPCLGCGRCGLYEAMTGNDKLKEKVVEFIKSCARCKHRPIGAMMCEESCHYEPKDEPQTERSE